MLTTNLEKMPIAAASTSTSSTILEERRVMFDKIQIRRYERSLGKNS